MIRSTFYTPEQIEAARQRCLPRLREFESECRCDNPIPTYDDLNSADRCRYEIYLTKMRSFTPYSPWRKTCIGILHSDLVGLSAARVVFARQLDCLVLLTAEERTSWYDTGDHIVDGWYWYLWWKIHTTIPARFRADVAERFSEPDGFEYWIFSHGRGSTAFHELWQYNGKVASVIERSYAAICAEHGPIDEWYE